MSGPKGRRHWLSIKAELDRKRADDIECERAAQREAQAELGVDVDRRDDDPAGQKDAGETG